MSSSNTHTDTGTAADRSSASLPSRSPDDVRSRLENDASLDNRHPNDRDAVPGGSRERPPSDLEQCEQAIRKHIKSTFEAGRAARRITNDKLYRQRGYSSVREYAKDRFGIGKSRWYELIANVELLDLIAENRSAIRDRLPGDTDVPLPTTASWMRPLNPHRDDTDFVLDVWAQVVSRHSASITMSKVSAVVNEVEAKRNPDQPLSIVDHPDPDTLIGSGSKTIGSGQDPGGGKPDGPDTPSPDGTGRDGTEGSSSADGADSGDSNPDQDQEGLREDGDDSSDSNDLGTDNPGEDDDSGEENPGNRGNSGNQGQDTADAQFQKHRTRFKDHLKGLAQAEARAVLSVAERLEDGELTSDHVRDSRNAYEQVLNACGGQIPEPISTEGTLSDTSEAASLIKDLDGIPTLSGLRAEDLEIEKEGETGLLISLPVTMIPEQLRPANSKSCLVDYHALVRAGMPPHLDLEAIIQEFQRLGVTPSFNRTKGGIEWAALSLNPVTGCRHGCPFCYAREIAMRFYPQGFTPTFYPERLLAIREAQLPKQADDDWRYRNTFITSMGDLFGKWIPDFMIKAVLREVEKREEFTFSFLTKYAKRLPDFEYPDNAWVGTSIIANKWVEPAEKAFADVDATVKWISAEPLKTDLTFNKPELFDWLVYGPQTAACGEPEIQPKEEWVDHLRAQARTSGWNVFEKKTLSVRPMSSPHETCDSREMPELWP